MNQRHDRMKPEPLRGKKFDLSEFEKDQNGFIIPYWKGYNDGVNKAFKTFESAVVFYKKYRNNENLLDEEHPEIFDKWNKHCKKMKDDFDIELPLQRIHYFEWFFDYCFADMIE